MTVLDRLRSVGRPIWAGDPDDLYEVINNPRRRLVTQFVEEEPKTHGDLSTEIARVQFGAPVSSTERKRVYIALYQVHLDKLVDNDVIEQTRRDAYQPGRNHDAAMAAIEAVNGVVDA